MDADQVCVSSVDGVRWRGRGVLCVVFIDGQSGGIFQLSLYYAAESRV